MNKIIFFLLFFIILFMSFILLNKYYTESFKNYTRTEVNNLLLKNAKKKNKIYKINIIKNKEDLKNCFRKCDYKNCLKLYQRHLNYNNCITCQKDKNKCFNRLDTLGSCDSCGKNLLKNNCNDINQFACPKLNDLFNNEGEKPYYLEVIDTKTNPISPYDQSCLFCWNLENYF